MKYRKIVIFLIILIVGFVFVNPVKVNAEYLTSEQTDKLVRGCESADSDHKACYNYCKQQYDAEDEFCSAHDVGIDTMISSDGKLYDKLISCYDLCDYTIKQEENDSAVKPKYDNCSSILGNPKDPDSVAWFINQIFKYVKILGPLLVLILSSLDFAKAIIQSDDDHMKKAQKKLIIRLLAVVLLFFLPDLVNLILQIFGLTTSPTCGIK